MSDMSKQEWWAGGEDVIRAAMSIERAGVGKGDDVLEKPWNWTAERSTVLKLEGFMFDRGVLPEDGWDMTLRELAALPVKR